MRRNRTFDKTVCCNCAFAMLLLFITLPQLQIMILLKKAQSGANGILKILVLYIDR